jgi:RNA polymerase sigma-70 factor (ECF subfamily)
MNGASGRATAVVEHLFRHQSGRLVAVLTRLFGIDRLGLAEDVVQDALVNALQQWPYHGVPENPAGWIMEVAKHRALDILRREQNLRAKERGIAEEILFHGGDLHEFFLEQEVEDDQLRMIFACCHPALTPESQIALTLKTLCGFGVAEISRAFLSSDETIRKRLLRAKQKLRELNDRFEIPAGSDLPPRLDTVLRVLYLLFNEGYTASHGEYLVRQDVCAGAIRLGRLLVRHPAGNNPAAKALLALMLLQASRLPARVDDHGNILLLQEQDRSRWNRKDIAEGLEFLDASAEGTSISEYHLQAGIAACHCTAGDFETTDWGRILYLYDALVGLNDSPVIALNRAVAIARVHGAPEGLRALDRIPHKEHLESYYLLHAVRGELYRETGRKEDAAASYRRALELTDMRTEQEFLRRKIHVAGRAPQ